MTTVAINASTVNKQTGMNLLLSSLQRKLWNIKLLQIKCQTEHTDSSSLKLYVRICAVYAGLLMIETAEIACHKALET